MDVLVKDDLSGAVVDIEKTAVDVVHTIGFCWGFITITLNKR